jgi:NADPH:quinone reductase-like Zn-dependent oxidoreductase
MQAVVQNDYGSSEVLKLAEIEKPVPDENEVLVEVHAASINAGDYFLLRGSPWVARLSAGFPKPNNYIPGYDVAGKVTAIGENVTRFQPGDEIYGECNGSFAEYVCGGEDDLALKPSSLSLHQAAAVPVAATTALQGLRDAGKIQPGQKVLINGASGGVGTYAVQIAKAFQAEVTGVCSTRNVDMVRTIGADHVIDYTREDFTQGEQRYDLILDNVANHSFSDLRSVLTPQGLIVPNSGHSGISYFIKATILSLFMKQQGSSYLAKANTRDLLALKEMIEAGKITPVIDRIFPLSETPAAFRYLEEEHARGKVVITVQNQDMP